MMENIIEQFTEGYVFDGVNNIATNSLDWNEHTLFKGVYLKHLIMGEETNGNLSCHMVKVNPGCVLETHVHTGKLEVHEVIAGSGTCFIGEEKISYIPGSVALIPADTSHRVTAGDAGVYILAKFSPALL